MEIKINFGNVGTHNAQIELAESFDRKDLDAVLDKVKRTAMELIDLTDRAKVSVDNTPKAEFKHTSKSATRTELPPQPTGDFMPASEQALKALYGAAMSNGSSVERVCREYGVDPNRISKEECREMTTDLNHKSGYDKIQQAQRENNYPKTPYPRTDKYPDDSDVFGK